MDGEIRSSNDSAWTFTMAVMRKRIVIALIGVVVVTGVGAYLVSVFSGPKRGSVEWHKKEYFGLIDQVYGRRLIDRLTVSIESKTRWQLRPNWKQDEQQLRRAAHVHQLALIDAGYIVQRRYVPLNRNAVRNAVVAASRTKQGERWYLTCHIVEQLGVIYVSGPLDDIELFEDFIRKADVPDWGGLLVPNIGVAGSGK